MNASSVLLTGGRAPVTADLARRFAEEGAFVVVADSQPNLTAASAAVGAAYRVPSARFRPWEFAAAVQQIARRHAASLVVPSCEETFWLAAAVGSAGAASGAADPATVRRPAGGVSAADRFRDPTPDLRFLAERLFAPPLATLRVLHDKAAFARLLGELGIAHPQTAVVSSAIAWRRAAARRGATAPAVVLKPAYSRFGTRTVRVAAGEPLPNVAGVSPEHPWLVQRELTGDEFCVSAVAVGGRITAFAAYRPVWRAGTGAAVAFERLDESRPEVGEARAVAERLAEHLGVTGLFGLDLLLGAADASALPRVHVLECNPRATSGLHLFGPGDGLAAAFSGRPAEVPGRRAARLALPHALYAVAGIRRPSDARRFVSQLHFPDALRPAGDRIRVTALLRSLAVQGATARTARVPLLAASTHDIEWNGEPLPTPRAGEPTWDSRGRVPSPSGCAGEPPWDSRAGAPSPAGRAGEPLPALSAGERPAGSRAGEPLPTGRAGAPSPAGRAGEWSPSAFPAQPARGEWAARLAALSAAEGGTRALAPNIDVELGTIPVAGHLLPLTLPNRHRRGAAGAEPASYVVSPLTHYVHYAREEIGELQSRPARLLARGAVAVLERVLRAGRVDDIALIGNALVSTNLLPALDEAEVATVTRELSRRHPRLAIGWRSVHGHGSALPDVLRRAGYRLIASRSVLFTDTRGAEWLSLRDVRRDRALLESSGYTVRPAAVDPATGMSDAPTRARIAELYRLLYTDKYSRLNPRYTPHFIGVAQRSGFLRFLLIERHEESVPGDPAAAGRGSIDAVIGYTVAHGLLAAPVVGYDTALPREAGLYRILSYVIALTAHEAGVELHASSGVADFKRNRGGEPGLEYTAVHTGHLPWRRRVAWAVLDTVVTRVALPMVERQGL
ncbi:ATP-grasp domain-containing protein [Herbiconiux sp. 11R-BC]|uniref:ATP-grasp domain-containing protein n=1 Tax=Herbiconiux sp. 11R-BC TaxID=3111637 RepID=UPI003C077956